MTIHSVVIQKLLSTNAHLGRRLATHHFKPFIYGSRNAMAIIDSDKTLISLRNALDFISHLARRNARFLFVNTNPLFDDIFDHMTQKIGYGSFTAKTNQYWRLGGFLTNSASPKKFKSRNKKLCFGPVHPPDCIVIVDTERKSSVINEAARLQIPVVGLVDSSVPRDVFEKITYPIPCNDSVQFVYLFCNLITKTFFLEQKNLKSTCMNTSSDDVKLEESNQSANKAEQSADETKQLKESESESKDQTKEESNQSTDEMKVVPYTA